MTAPSDQDILSAYRQHCAALTFSQSREKLKAEFGCDLSVDVCSPLPSEPSPASDLTVTPQRLKRIISQSRLPYVIRPTISAGLGVFTSQPIAAGTCVIRETPPLVGTTATIDKLFDALSPVNKKAVLKLTSFGPGETLPQRILHSNAHACEGGGAILPIIARINHSCTPNCEIQFDAGEATVYAIKDLRQGEEMTLAYCERLLSREERREVLSARYAFQCGCETCEPVAAQGALTEALVTASDARRKLANDLDSIIMKDKNSSRRVAAVVLRLRTLREEGLVGGDRSRTLYDALQLFTLKDTDCQIAHVARLAMDQYKLCGNLLAAQECQNIASQSPIESSREIEIWNSILAKLDVNIDNFAEEFA